jgi:hypothetical protein
MRRRRAVISAAVLALVVALGGCGGDDGEDQGDARDRSTSTSEPDGSDGSTGDGSGGGSGTSDGSTGDGSDDGSGGGSGDDAPPALASVRDPCQLLDVTAVKEFLSRYGAPVEKREAQSCVVNASSSASGAAVTAAYGRPRTRTDYERVMGGTAAVEPIAGVGEVAGYSPAARMAAVLLDGTLVTFRFASGGLGQPAVDEVAVRDLLVAQATRVPTLA